MAAPDADRLVAVQYAAREATWQALFPQARRFVATQNGEAVGRIVAAERGDHLHVVDIAVHRDRRRTGVARAMLQAVMAKRVGATATIEAEVHADVRADVYVGNAASLALFASLGFVGEAAPGAAQVALAWREPAVREPASSER